MIWLGFLYKCFVIVLSLFTTFSKVTIAQALSRKMVAFVLLDKVMMAVNMAIASAFVEDGDRSIAA